MKARVDGKTRREVVELLANTNLTFREIAEVAGVKYNYVSSVNAGRLEGMEALDYSVPIRETTTQRNKKIKEDLRAGLTVDEVAKKYDLSFDEVYKQKKINSKK